MSGTPKHEPSRTPTTGSRRPTPGGLLGAGRRELGTDFRSPYQALVDYLDVLDERGLPKQRRALAALGPRVLKLAAERSAGAHPFLVTPAYTRRARELVGPDALVAAEHKVALGDPTSTRAAGREAIQVNFGAVELPGQPEPNGLRRTRPGISAGTTSSGMTDGCSVTATAAPISRSTPGRASSGR